MANLGSLIISLEANVSRFESSMSRAEYLAKKSSDSIISSLKVVGTAMAGIFSISAMDKAFDRITSMESQLVKTASRLNTSAETLSSFGVMARKTGMDSDAFITVLTRMDKGLSAAALGAETASGKFDENGEEILKTSKTYDELGLKAQELIKLPLTDRLMAIAEAMERNIAPGDRVRIAMELGGKSAAGMVNAFKEGPEALQKMIDRQKELGVITDDMAKRGAAAKTAASELSEAWSNFARELVDNVAPSITWVTEKLTELLIAARKTAQARADIAAGVHTGDFGEWGGEGGTNVGKERGPRGVTGSWISEDIFKPATRAKPETGGGKGGGADSALRQLESFINTMTAETAKAAGDSMATLEAWYNKQTANLKNLEAKTGESLEAQWALYDAYVSKKEKLEADFSRFVAEEADKDREQIKKDQVDKLDLQRSILNDLASATPYLSQQLDIKARMLPLEQELARLALEESIERKNINPELADQLRMMLALTNQAKRYALERERWEKEGVGGGMKMWGTERLGEMEKRGATQAMAAMKDAESWMGDTFGDVLVNKLHGKKTDLTKLFSDITDNMVKRFAKMGVEKGFDALAGIFGIKGLTGKPDGTALKPFHVVMSPLGGGGKGLLDIFGGGGGENNLMNLPEAFNETFMNAEMGLTANYLNYAEMFTMAEGGLLSTSSNFGGMFSSAISGFGSLFESFLGMLSNLLSSSGGGGGGIFGDILSIGGILAAPFTGGASLIATAGTMLPFHEGTGPIYAHKGLAPDEYPAILLRNERVLSPEETRAYESGGRLRGGEIHIHQNNAYNFDRRPTGYELREIARKQLKAANDAIRNRN